MSSVPRLGAGRALLACACIALPAGCASVTSTDPIVVDGSGPVRTETRAVGAFTKVGAEHGIDVGVTVGTPWRVEVTAQENLLELTTTSVSDGVLVIRVGHDFVSDEGIVAAVTAPSLTELVLRDGAVGRVEGLDEASFAVHAEAGARLTVTGKSDWLGLSGHGAAALDLDAFVARNATVELTTGVVARIRVTDSISGSVSDGVVLTVCGAPTTVDVRTADGARVIREDGPAR